jgi:hypothetical protein
MGRIGTDSEHVAWSQGNVPFLELMGSKFHKKLRVAIKVSSWPHGTATPLSPSWGVSRESLVYMLSSPQACIVSAEMPSLVSTFVHRFNLCRPPRCWSQLKMRLKCLPKCPLQWKIKSLSQRKTMCGIFIDTRNYVSAAGPNFLVNSIYEYTHHMRFKLPFASVDA